jgi:outer membrane protein assembly factor BamB
MKSALRFLSLAFILLLTPCVALWVHRSEMTHLWWVVFGAGMFSLLFLGLWYLVFGKAPLKTRRKRFGVALMAFALIGIIASRVIRYEGSTSGSSFPKFAWAWSPRTDDFPPPVIEATPATNSVDLTGAVADLTDFLGPDRDGMWDSPTFGTDWKTNPPELIWRRPIGKGWSGYTVSGNRAFTQQQVGDDEHVTALDLVTGADLWSHADPQTRLLLERAENGGAAMGGDGPRATPVLHAGRVYTMGGTGIVNCLDLATGEEIWSRHLLRELGRGRAALGHGEFAAGAR